MASHRLSADKSAEPVEGDALGDVDKEVEGDAPGDADGADEGDALGDTDGTVEGDPLGDADEGPFPRAVARLPNR
jgi:hypothetical protein